VFGCHHPSIATPRHATRAITWKPICIQYLIGVVSLWATQREVSTQRSPQEKMPQREACLEGGYIATRRADGKSVRFKRTK